MQYFNQFFLGWAMGTVGIILPGIVNMTVVDVSVRKGLRAAINYSAGGALAMFFQIFIAVAFTGYLIKHPEVVAFLKQISILVFLVLSIAFYILARKAQVKKAESKSKRSFLVGFIVSSMNVLAIPYYFAVSAYFRSQGLITATWPCRWIYVIGATAGAFGLLLFYARFAQYIARRAQYFTRNINYILSIFFLSLAVLQMVNLYAEY
jgi:threonine/homoserine/homoserine lactone efflux protein